MIFGIFRGHAALQSRIRAAARFPAGAATTGLVQFMALRNQDLRAHQVDARDHLGDRVLNLDSRIHFDEIPLLRIDIEQEFHRAGIPVARRLGNSHGGVA